MGKIETVQEREKKNIENQKKEIKETCTFKPQINEVSQILAKSREMEE